MLSVTLVLPGHSIWCAISCLGASFHWGALPILKLSARYCRNMRFFTEAINVLMTSLICEWEVWRLPLQLHESAGMLTWHALARERRSRGRADGASALSWGSQQADWQGALASPSQVS